MASFSLPYANPLFIQTWKNLTLSNASKLPNILWKVLKCRVPSLGFLFLDWRWRKNHLESWYSSHCLIGIGLFLRTMHIFQLDYLLLLLISMRSWLLFFVQGLIESLLLLPLLDYTWRHHQNKFMTLVGLSHSLKFWFHRKSCYQNLETTPFPCPSWPRMGFHCNDLRFYLEVLHYPAGWK